MLHNMVEFATENPYRATASALAFTAFLVAIWKAFLEKATGFAVSVFGVMLEEVSRSFYSSTSAEYHTFRTSLNQWLELPHVQRPWDNGVREAILVQHDATTEYPVTTQLGVGSRMVVWYEGWPVLITITSRAEKYDDEALYLNLSTVFKPVSFLAGLLNKINTEGSDGEAKLVVCNLRGEDWMSSLLPIRPFSSVLLDAADETKIREFVDKFLERKDFCRRTYIPHRTGMLLWGPPGSGKSTVVRAIATEYKMALHTINLAASDLDDATLLAALIEAGHSDGPVLVLMEDISALNLGTQRDNGDADGSSRKKKKKRDGVTVSGILNAVDGVNSPENVIFVYTANAPETLDPALYRNGRVDLQIRLGEASECQARRMFLRFFPEHPDLADRFAAAVGQDGKVSMAEIQSLCVSHLRDPTAILTAVAKDGFGRNARDIMANPDAAPVGSPKGPRGPRPDSAEEKQARRRFIVRQRTNPD